MAASPETKEMREAREEREEFEARIARAFGHPHRVRIMELLNEDDASATDLARKIGVPNATLNYHFDVLEECGCIEWVDSVPTASTRTHVYRSLQPTLFADLAWSTLSPHIRAEISQTVIRNMLRRLKDALEAATFDAKETRNLSVQTVPVDWTGWDQIHELMDETMERVAAIAEEAGDRATADELFPATVTLMSYESPRMYEKQPDA